MMAKCYRLYLLNAIALGLLAFSVYSSIPGAGLGFETACFAAGLILVAVGVFVRFKPLSPDAPMIAFNLVFGVTVYEIAFFGISDGFVALFRWMTENPTPEIRVNGLMWPLYSALWLSAAVRLDHRIRQERSLV